jgi:hypothetical protein
VQVTKSGVVKVMYFKNLALPHSVLDASAG